MQVQVILELVLLHKSFLTEVTRVRFLTGMCACVCFQVAFERERLPAQLAAVRFDAVVQPHVSLQIDARTERFAACCAHVGCVVDVLWICALVDSKALFCSVGFVA